MIILGLDPGTATTGYGVIKVDNNKTIHVDHGCIITASNLPMAERLSIIATELRKLIAQHKPDRVSIEEIFFFKNATTVISVAQARGVLVAVATEAGIPVHGYTPLQVKQALTSYGRADKQQMQKMITLLLGLPEIPKPDDAADGLAIAITCANSVRSETMYS